MVMISDELGMSKSVECHTLSVFPFSALTLLVMRHEGRPAAGCRFVGGDDLTGALQFARVHLSPPRPSSLTLLESRMGTLSYRVVPLNGR